MTKYLVTMRDGGQQSEKEVVGDGFGGTNDGILKFHKNTIKEAGIVPKTTSIFAAGFWAMVEIVGPEENVS